MTDLVPGLAYAAAYLDGYRTISGHPVEGFGDAVQLLRRLAGGDTRPRLHWDSSLEHAARMEQADMGTDRFLSAAAAADAWLTRQPRTTHP